MANSSSKLSSLNVSPMDFPHSIISDQYDLFMNKIIEEQVDITISKSQVLQILYLVYSTVLHCYTETHVPQLSLKGHSRNYLEIIRIHH